ncbi:MAG: hypothetical protein WAP47_09585 [Candidatus Rokuibacteriota bacterium]
MAILGAPIPWLRHESRKGIYIVRRAGGQVIQQAWPRRRKARRTQLQLRKERDFAAAVLAIKWMDPSILAGYQDRYASSSTLWRDALMATIYGTAFALTTTEGATIYPQQFRDKVSRSLDLLGAESGALLARGAGQWQTIPPGPTGALLTSQGPGSLPQWAT